MNKLDLYAVPDTTDAEECAYENAENIIGAFTGRDLFESGTVDIDSLLDAFGMPDVFDSSLAGDKWDDMTPDEQGRWGVLLIALRQFAYDRLDDEKAMRHADDLAA